MLKNIVFLLKSENQPQNPDEDVRKKLCTNLSECDPENTLVVTDSVDTLNELKRKNYAVLFLSKEEGFIDGAEYVVWDLEDCDFSYFETIFCRLKKLPLTILETERTVVREMTVEDLPALYELYDDDVIREFIEPLYDYEEEKEYTINYIKNMYGFYGLGMWLVFDKKSGKLAGRAGIGIRNIDGKDSYELGYLIGKNFRRKGYALEVCQGIIDYFKEKYKTEELHIVCEQRNLPSCKLASRLGFFEHKRLTIDCCEYMIFQRKE